MKNDRKVKIYLISTRVFGYLITISFYFTAKTDQSDIFRLRFQNKLCYFMIVFLIKQFFISQALFKQDPKLQEVLKNPLLNKTQRQSMAVLYNKNRISLFWKVILFFSDAVNELAAKRNANALTVNTLSKSADSFQIRCCICLIIGIIWRLVGWERSLGSSPWHSQQLRHPDERSQRRG